MMYKAVLKLTIFDDRRTKCVSGTKVVEFPFAPYEGLEIAVKWTCTYKLKHVTWSIDEECFHCLIEDQENYETDNGSLSGPIDMQFLIDEARACGWTGFEKIVDLSPGAT